MDLPPQRRSAGHVTVVLAAGYQLFVRGTTVECPLIVVATRECAVPQGQLDVFEPVEVFRIRRVARLVTLPMFDRVPSLSPRRTKRRIAGQVDNRFTTHPMLEMRLANQRGAVSVVTQLADERGRIR